jgi:hypothetical protein
MHQPAHRIFVVGINLVTVALGDRAVDEWPPVEPAGIYEMQPSGWSVGQVTILRRRIIRGQEAGAGDGQVQSG